MLEEAEGVVLHHHIFRGDGLLHLISPPANQNNQNQKNAFGPHSTIKDVVNVHASFFF